MNNEWVIEVLKDIRKFSAANQLNRLADQLDDAIIVASSEVGNPELKQPIGEDIVETPRHARGAQPSNCA